MAAVQKEPSPVRKTPKLVSFTLIALGATAVIVPFLFLRRVRPPTISSELRNVAPPPIRRAGVLSVKPTSLGNLSSSTPPMRRVDNSAGPRAVEPRNREEAGASGEEEATPGSAGSGAALYALKAFGVASCLVAASAVASVWVVRWSMGVQTTEEFAARMRAKMLSFAPSLSARIYRTLTPADSTPGLDHTLGVSPPHPTGPASSSEEWAWADASERLSRAYEEGGFARWMLAAVKELEHDTSVERRRRGYREGGGNVGS